MNRISNIFKNLTNSQAKQIAKAINKETNEQILQILNAPLPDGKTVKESILNQIT